MNLQPELVFTAQRGFKLLPVRGKVPLLADWPRRATSDLGRLEAWAAQFPGSNWGIATGPASNLLVLDIDGQEGRESVVDLERQGLILPQTLSVTTGRGDGGEHRYFRMPSVNVRNSQGAIARHIDVRAAGGFVVAPPSVHPSGTPYRFVDPEVQVQAPPAWLIERLSKQSMPTKPSTELHIGRLVDGRRNDGLMRYGAAMRRKGAELPELQELLLEANSRRCKPPLPEDEICKIAASVSRYDPGGPDPLLEAWAIVQVQPGLNTYGKFVALARELQRARFGQSIALPLQRIGELLEIHWTLASRLRRRAVSEGLLTLESEYIAHRRAALYSFIDSGLTRPRVSLSLTSVTSGLVRPSPSETVPPSETGNASTKEMRPKVENQKNEAARGTCQPDKQPPVNLPTGRKHRGGDFESLREIMEGSR